MGDGKPSSLFCVEFYQHALQINTKQDAATMLATEYNPTEIQYFKLVVRPLSSIMSNN
jgi:hypothetical protein